MKTVFLILSLYWSTTLPSLSYPLLSGYGQLSVHRYLFAGLVVSSFAGRREYIRELDNIIYSNSSDTSGPRSSYQHDSDRSPYVSIEY
ncbi:hypothetical protein KTO58_07240 [Chitinophaga pendula]|uniref:hypothetical protein n=1 Tax=Chitinophaga TaxID=79328 RepID=UPI0012FDADF2|nr:MULTISPECIES: hypothetical protein [Chitinophaga]UCJ08970.1 hypothetical protein KTO58_07240 [Chitinophaga pendula]